jgi:thiamine biosynthesis lipoprotein
MPPRRVLIPELSEPPVPRAEARFRLRWAGRSMGTTWSVTAFGDAAAAARRDEIGAGLAAQLALVVRQMSHFDPCSALSRFNYAPAASWVDLPEGLFQLLHASVELASATGGLFDPTLGEAVSLWGFGADPVGDLPDPASVLAALGRCGWRKLRLDPARRAAWQPGGLQLNLGAIAKGFAVDLAIDWLRRCGLAAALVEIGGELSGFGVKPDATPWWIAVENPPHSGRGFPQVLIALVNCAVASSGVWVQRRWQGALACTHLINPATGFPSEGPVIGATVLHRSAMAADAWATALCVAPLPGARHLARCHGIAARILYRDREGRLRQWLSPAMRRLAF